MDISQIPANVLCTKTHEYIIEENGVAKIGITDFAVEQLGDIVFVELPDVGSELSKTEPFGTIESVKAASEIYMPVSGKIVEINETVITQPELINDDCYNQGWLIKVEGYDKEELSEAMALDEYREFTEEEH